MVMSLLGPSDDLCQVLRVFASGLYVGSQAMAVVGNSFYDCAITANALK